MEKSNRCFSFVAFLVALIAGFFTVGLYVQAAETNPEILWREKLRVVVTTNGLAVAADTSVVTDATSKTPSYIGQHLFGRAGTGTNAVWVAKGLTTNDWVQIAP